MSIPKRHSLGWETLLPPTPVPSEAVRENLAQASLLGSWVAALSSGLHVVCPPCAPLTPDLPLPVRTPVTSDRATPVTSLELDHLCKHLTSA